MITRICGMSYYHNLINYEYFGQDQVRDYGQTAKLTSCLIKETDNPVRIPALQFQVTLNEIN